MSFEAKHPGTVYWATTLGDAAVCPPLTDTTRADVCIVGGGFAGLWTAIELKRRSADIDVVVLEAVTCGSGASGRNGGWATSYWRRFDDLVRHFGTDQALWVGRAAHDALVAIGDFVAEHDIDCDWRQQGGVWASTRPGAAPWSDAVAAVAAAGHGDALRVLDGARGRELVGSPVLRGAAVHTDTASVNPARLVRGMRRVALELGVRIHEASPMTMLHRGRPAVVHTQTGQVHCEQVCLALGAWSADVRELRRAYVTVGSQVVATAPLGKAVAELPWSNGLVFGDDQLSVHYAQVTTDHRIVFGRALGPLGFRNKVTPRHVHDAHTARIVAADFARLFPQFAEATLTHSWGGAVDRAPHGLPTVGTLGPEGNVHYVVGFSGQGVAQSRLLGRVLAAVAAGADDEYARNALVGSPLQYFPPEPLRYLGGRAVKSLVTACERRVAKGHPSPVSKSTLKVFVGAHVPAALEPRRRRNGSRMTGARR